MECTKCKATFEAREATSPSLVRAELEVLKEWRFWVIGFVLMLVAGMIGGGMNFYPAGFVGGAGAVLAIIIVLRGGTVRKCPSCGAFFQSAPWLGKKNAG